MQRDLNPFFHRGPIREPAFFFGRRDALAFLVEMLQQGQSVAIHGQRRFGKTSLLFQLARPEVAAEYGFDSGATDWAYIDGGMLDGLDETWLWGAIGQAQGGSEDAIAYPRLVERLRALQRQGRRVVVALDEFELLAGNPLLGLSVFNRLRSLAAQLPVQFVTASKRPLFDLTFAHADTLSSPFFNIFAPWQLGLLGDDDADALLATLSERGRRPFAAQTRAILRALVGPHPLFLQIAGYHAFAALQGANGELDEAARAEVRRRILADLEAHLRYYWTELDPAAHYNLAALALSGAAGGMLAGSGLVQDGQYLGSAVEAFVRQQHVEGLLQCGPLLLDTRRGLAATRNGPVHLTPTERAALQLFLERAGQVVTLDEIEAVLWPGETSLDPERARGVVKKLRAALGPEGEAIVNRRGHGWLLQPDP